jgi:acetyl esterase/lipase
MIYKRIAAGVLTCALMAAACALFAEPGKLIDVKKVETLTPAQIDKLFPPLWVDVKPPQTKYTVDSYLIHFESTYLDGSATPVTAQVFVPRFTDSAKRILYMFAAGSTGLIDACRPSREHLAGIHWGLYRTHVLAHVGQGVIGVLPDYMGFGDPNPAHLQPYMSAVAEGRMMLDAIRAVQTYIAQSKVPGVAGTSVFVGGFSQGGHAAFAAADLRATYAPDVHIDGVIGYGPSTNVQTLFKEFADVAPMALYTYSWIYGTDKIDPSKLLLPKFAATLKKDVTRQCVGGMQSYYPQNPRLLFTKDFADALVRGDISKGYPEVAKVLAENTTGLSGHKIPALILQGTDDIVVSVPSQEAFIKALCQAGSPVEYILFKGRRHDTRQIGFEQARAWMAGITKGDPAPSNCGGLQ